MTGRTGEGAGKSSEMTYLSPAQILPTHDARLRGGLLFRARQSRKVCQPSAGVRGLQIYDRN